MDRSREIVARNVRTMRRAKDWTQTDLAKASGTAQTSISYIERGAKSPTVDIIDGIAKAFGVPAWAMLIDYALAQEEAE